MTRISQKDLDLIIGLMDSYSPFFHDQPPEAAIPDPDLNDLKHDLKKLTDWADEFERRKRKTGA